MMIMRKFTDAHYKSYQLYHRRDKTTFQVFKAKLNKKKDVYYVIEYRTNKTHNQYRKTIKSILNNLPIAFDYGTERSHIMNISEKLTTIQPDSYHKKDRKNHIYIEVRTYSHNKKIETLIVLKLGKEFIMLYQ